MCQHCRRELTGNKAQLPDVDGNPVDDETRIGKLVVDTVSCLVEYSGNVEHSLHCEASRSNDAAVSEHKSTAPVVELARKHRLEGGFQLEYTNNTILITLSWAKSRCNEVPAHLYFTATDSVPTADEAAQTAQ